MNDQVPPSTSDSAYVPDAFLTGIPYGLRPVTRTPAGVPARELQRAWFGLVRQRRWRTLAVLPASQGFSCLGVAHGLAAMAAHEPSGSPLLVNVSDCPDAIVGGDDERCGYRDSSSETPRNGSDPGSYRVLDFTQRGINESDVALGGLPGLLQARVGGFSSYSRVIVAVSSPLERPISLAVLQAVDAAVLCVEIGTTDFHSAHNTLKAVGIDSLVGCIAVRPWDPQ